ncbi:hypothetical protein [Halobacillus shinanisalinarum]|nr:hypothetical protein [Halobacillus shinanisalinarum]
MATFEHSIFLELGISALEQLKVPKENILAVPLNKRTEKSKLFDTIHQSDGISLFDLAAALATAFSVIGGSVGFHLEWGPIIWGIIGAIGGSVLGFLIDILTTKVKHDRQRKVKEKTSELILIVHCDSDQVEKIEKILWDNLAFGVAVLDNENQSV